MKQHRKSTATQYYDFKMRRLEIRRLENKNRLKRIEEAKNMEARTFFVKENLCRDISRYGSLQLSLDQVDEKLSNQLTCDNEKRMSLKHQLQFDRNVILLAKIWTQKVFSCQKKGKQVGS